MILYIKSLNQNFTYHQKGLQMIKILKTLSILLTIAAISINARDYKKVDKVPELKKDEMSTWLVIFRDKNRQSDELYMNVYIDGKYIADVEDNTLSFVEIPADGKEQVLYVKAAEHTEEYMNIVPQPGKVFFLQMFIRQYGGSHSHEEIKLDLLAPEELKKKFDDEKDIHKTEFCIPKKNLGEMKERKWKKVLEEYEEWKEDNEEDYNKFKSYMGHEEMPNYDFTKK